MAASAGGPTGDGRPVAVAMHCLYFPPEVGGLESHVYDLCRSLAGRGNRVEMVTSRSLPGTPRREVMEGIRVRRTWFPGRHPPGWALASAAAAPALWSACRRSQVVHAHTFASGLVAALVAPAAGLPLVLTVHTSHFLRRARRRRWRPLFRWLLGRADHVFATSREIAGVAERVAPGAAVEAITNAVDVDRFRPDDTVPEAADGEVLLVVPRRLFPKNGVEDLIRALPRIRDRMPVRARLVGDGPERPRLETLTRSLGVEGAVEFLGARPHDEMPGILRGGDVAVIPSLMEATSVAALEAMACGVPVAASRTGGLPEIVDESVGTLFEPGDPTDLADRVVDLLTRDDLAEAGRRARKRVVERWSLDRLAGRHEEVYRGLATPESGPGRQRTRGGGHER